ncbi:hypothetical protein Shyhy02_07980 [Streptomyces hygroscopicus subsp. hygroscopicus]|nr:hypothetical protein Shyhy02_07980 [Streptomyces hygroscopicus subsp. hygroscopicus]
MRLCCGAWAGRRWSTGGRAVGTTWRSSRHHPGHPGADALTTRATPSTDTLITTQAAPGTDALTTRAAPRR